MCDGKQKVAEMSLGVRRSMINANSLSVACEIIDLLVVILGFCSPSVMFIQAYPKFIIQIYKKKPKVLSFGLIIFMTLTII